MADAASKHPGLSGLHLLPDARDAFAARVLLIRTAERTLDLQYYIWHGDRSGTLLLEAVHQAAERGVRVRLLLDDNGIAGLDKTLSALDAHPNIAIRLFNPFRIRFPKAIGYLTDFTRLNRRMHNKSLTADAAATIVGGRNVGDEYFGAGDGGLFADLDVLAIGPIVADVATDFDRYWNSEASYSARQILRPVSPYHLRRLSRRASIVERDPATRVFVDHVRTLPIVQDLLAGTIDLCWATVTMVSDLPEKALGKVRSKDLLASSLERVLGRPERELAIVAGYFVPGDAIVSEFAGLAASGVGVHILSNSYAANDVGLVHAGYAPARRPLLEAGVHLYEICGAARSDGEKRKRRTGTRVGIGSTLRGSGTGSTAALRSGVSTLHAKTFAVDRKRLFVGSFNLDPRSHDLNTELGFVIDDPVLASRVIDAFDDTIPQAAYEVRIENGDMVWIDRRGDEPVVHRREPGMALHDHLLIAVARRLPIDWLL